MNDNVVTVKQMKEIEQKSAKSGLSYYKMMENAGTAAYEYIKNLSRNIKSIVVFCGKGNNGGDGFVAARKFKEDGANVIIILVDGQPKTEDANINMELCEALHIPIINIISFEETAIKFSNQDYVIVDAIYGTGFHGVLNQNARLAAQWINKSTAPVFALDIPSGLNGDSGEAAADAVRADYTIAFHKYKPVHVAEDAKPYCGNLLCADIGINGF